MNVPTHVAIIMDGNGRWAKQQGLARIEGHKKGLSAAERIIDFSIEKGVKYLSLYVFSTENWKRPKAEITGLFSLAERYLSKLEKFCKDRIRVVVSGEAEGLPPRLVKKIADIQQKTAGFGAICVNLCINYGGRKEIVEAAKRLAAKGEEISEQSLLQNLYSPFIPEPDLIVRTGGQKRLSNFLLFQSAYAELCFTDTLWPDFSNAEFEAILTEFTSRTRNFGGIETR